MSNEELIQQIISEKAQDQSEGLRYMYRTYHASFYAVLRRRGVEKETFEDCFQEAIIQIIQKLRKSEKIDNIGGYLRTIVFTQSLKKTVGLEKVDPMEITIPDPTPSPNLKLEQAQLTQYIQRLMNHVDMKCWEIFELRLNRIPWKEVSQILGISEGKGKMTHRRCMEKLIGWLEQRPRLFQDLLADLGKTIS
ncbi:MAG: sigma-70 family RNA polymerase sigma factor [Bacteroidota bacterium]